MTYEEAKDEALRILDDTDLEWQCFLAWTRKMMLWCYVIFYLIAVVGFVLCPQWVLRAILVASSVGMGFSYRKFARIWKSKK